MNIVILKQYARNTWRVLAVAFIAVSLLWIGDKTQVVTYTQLATDYLNKVEVKKTVVHGGSSSIKAPDKVAKKEQTQAQTPKKDVLWEHVGKLKGEYVVKKGDTLWNIARKHDVPPKKLLLANNMTSDTKLRPGQLLTIPK
ncbi:MAG: LysM peptidoglycan-binding domain-containing protein [Patescibacteria group bacterium]